MPTPTLVIMAAGMGSRFGGLKQITAVDAQGHAIIDYSLFDAYRAGFRRVVFIIKHAIEDDFKASVGQRAEEHFEVHYVYQELDRLPKGFAVPEGRSKPWGTGHAVACCRGLVDGPFAVINADDFYGAGAFETLYDYLSKQNDPNEHAMVAYRLRNTVTDSGSVARGICEVVDGYLSSVTERTNIVKRGNDAAWTEDGTHYTDISGEQLVSMNFWGFGKNMLDALCDGFPAFLSQALEHNPLKGEYFLPSVVNDVLSSAQGRVRVLPCSEVWYGMTYREDIDAVRAAIARMTEEGRYPATLWH